MKQRTLVVFSRHPSHNTLRRLKVQCPALTSLRLGSVTRGNIKYAVELNPPEAVEISSNKLLMKQKFTEAGITTPEWWVQDSGMFMNKVTNRATPKIELPFPLVSKSLRGSRGLGNALHRTLEDFDRWAQGKNLANYIFEKFHNYSREYRLHISRNGCFYTCRKMLKSDTPADKRWYRNDSNSVWVLEDNPSFNRPTTWDTIVSQCVAALNAIGLDLAAFDVKVASENNAFIIIESNSAPSFGEVTLQKYAEEIPKIVNQKLNP